MQSIPTQKFISENPSLLNNGLNPPFFFMLLPQQSITQICTVYIALYSTAYNVIL